MKYISPIIIALCSINGLMGMSNLQEYTFIVSSPDAIHALFDHYNPQLAKSSFIGVTLGQMAKKIVTIHYANNYPNISESRYMIRLTLDTHEQVNKASLLLCAQPVNIKTVSSDDIACYFDKTNPFKTTCYRKVVLTKQLLPYCCSSCIYEIFDTRHE